MNLNLKLSSLVFIRLKLNSDFPSLVFVTKPKLEGTVIVVVVVVVLPVVVVVVVVAAVAV